MFKGLFEPGLDEFGYFAHVSLESWSQNEELQYVEEWEEGRNEVSAIG